MCYKLDQMQTSEIEKVICLNFPKIRVNCENAKKFIEMFTKIIDIDSSIDQLSTKALLETLMA